MGNKHKTHKFISITEIEGFDPSSNLIMNNPK